MVLGIIFISATTITYNFFFIVIAGFHNPFMGVSLWSTLRLVALHVLLSQTFSFCVVSHQT